ncbi:MAG: aspartate/glutamate racemase family protein [Deltaproteobacteria bacterium]|nr:aspartate/glutamate racemase family protein [Deltaproteobacteria bacterium]
MTTTGKDIPSLLSKDEVVVLVTDSGLGGFSIFSQIAARAKHDPIFSRLSLIYYNAWPGPNRGYNSLKDMDTRVRVFDRALEGMLRFTPHMILIACNTLSVLYERTRFRRRKPIPVVDIVGFGVDMVYERLLQNTDARALLLGTATTIESDRHRSRLIEKGIPANRIAVQACDQLATRIEKGPESDAVVELVDVCMDRAAEKLGSLKTDVLAALFCTHFGYSRELIRKSLQCCLPGKVTVLDPNQRMVDSLFEATGGRRHPKTVVEMAVVSKIAWEKEKLDAVSNRVAPGSPEAADALRRYQWIPDLFDIDDMFNE